MMKKRNIAQWVILLVLGVMLISQSPSTAQATNHTETASLKIVFLNTLYGAAIGIPVGLAFWGLQQDQSQDDEDELRWEPFVIRGAAFGVLLGVGYGFYEVNRLGGFAHSLPIRRGLVHYDANHFYISPAQGLPYLTFEKNKPKFNSTIFTANF